MGNERTVVPGVAVQTKKIECSKNLKTLLLKKSESHHEKNLLLVVYQFSPVHLL